MKYQTEVITLYKIQHIIQFFLPLFNVIIKFSYLLNLLFFSPFFSFLTFPLGSLLF